MEVVPEPGMPDIKWVELYKKWGKFVPEDKKKKFKYYHEKPPETIATQVKEASKAAKDARKARTKSKSKLGSGNRRAANSSK